LSSIFSKFVILQKPEREQGRNARRDSERIQKKSGVTVQLDVSPLLTRGLLHFWNIRIENFVTTIYRQGSSETAVDARKVKWAEFKGRRNLKNVGI